jgi:hypothetical protein
MSNGETWNLLTLQELVDFLFPLFDVIVAFVMVEDRAALYRLRSKFQVLG